MLYIVWVGGVPDYEGTSLKMARYIFKQWINSGYQDVILEEVYQ